ncbi:MAG: hypothetical protein AAGG01_02640, partial [Planctomycetota bacterium]
RGDRFDVVAARTVEPPPVVKAQAQGQAKAKAPAALGVYASLLPTPEQAKPAAPTPKVSVEAQPRVDVIVQCGVVVTALETRLVPTSSSSLTAGQINGTRPVQEMVIALAPEEVAPLMAAMRMGADLSCLARSGRPEDDADSETPGLLPDFLLEVDEEPVTPEPDPESEQRADVRVVEKIVGGVRTLVAVPRPKASAEAGSQ